MARRPKRPVLLDPDWRQAFSFFIGLGFAGYEIVLRDAKTERPFVLGFIAALIGVPVFDAVSKLGSRRDEEPARE